MEKGMNFKSITLSVAALLIPAWVNASVINTLNSNNYEWLELTETAGMSRNSVQATLDAAVAGDAWYGYEFASRELVEDLFLSYATFDGSNGFHGDPDVVSGVSDMLNDFGVLFYQAGNGVDDPFSTVDGYTVNIDSFYQSFAMYGSVSACAGDSCVANILLYTSASGEETMAYQSSRYGYDATYPLLGTVDLDISDPDYGSFLVRSAVVPVPAAAWLFVSGLIGLAGIARIKNM